MRTRRNDFDLFEGAIKILTSVIFVIVIGVFVGIISWGIYNESNHLTEGIVIDKDYSPAYTIYTHTNGGKTVAPEYRAANYQIQLQGEKDGEMVTYWRVVTEQEYHAVSIGDHYPPGGEE